MIKSYIFSFFFIFFSFCFLKTILAKKYEPNWESLDSRPLPNWYDEAKIGIFIHWGVFSVPSFKSEWFWWRLDGTQDIEYRNYMKDNFPPNFKYQDFANNFKAEFFNADDWADLFHKSGAKYIVLTSKHHEGFTLWPSKTSWNWNSVDLGPKRDIVGELEKAIKKKNLHFGLYHSLFEWFNPLWLQDKANNYETNYFVENKVIPEVFDLVNTYKPDVIWSDGEWNGTSEYWQSKEFLAWLYNESPVKNSVVVNDRWGLNTSCHHGGFLSCADRYSPGVKQQRKWENAMTIDKDTWGFSRKSDLSNYLTFKEITQEIAKTVSCGGNILINVGPRSDGTIDVIFQQRLLELGNWLSYAGQGIYGSVPFKIQNDTISKNVWYTSKNNGETIYAFFFEWPENFKLELSLNNYIDIYDYHIYFLTPKKEILTDYDIGKNSTLIDLPKEGLINTKDAYVLKFQLIHNN